MESVTGSPDQNSVGVSLTRQPCSELIVDDSTGIIHQAIRTGSAIVCGHGWKRVLSRKVSEPTETQEAQ